jgi:uncharacterized iron-regulated protein
MIRRFAAAVPGRAHPGVNLPVPRSPIVAALIASCCLAVILAAAPVDPVAAADDAARACRPGSWLDPASGAVLRHPEVIAGAASRDVVLLGESHDNLEHHRWQLATVAGLLGRRDDLVLGFEAFPRRVQPILDRWVAGELDEKAFLDAVQWREIWGFDPELYLPLFRLARQYRLPMVALNVERDLVTRVGREGWASVPEAEREGVGNPAAPSTAYVDRLAGYYAQHQPPGPRADTTTTDAAKPDAAAARQRPEFQHFVDAQLTWDRAMAEALATATGRRSDARPLVIGIVGSEHLLSRHGVPHQLAALGIENTAVLLPYDAPEGCGDVAAGIADAVFMLAAPENGDLPKPRLGVALDPSEGEVRVLQVMPGSVAEATGLRVGDTIVEAAGVAVRAGPELVAIVQRQAPGTWLPISLQRGEQRLELVAKFPPAAS